MFDNAVTMSSNQLQWAGLVARSSSQQSDPDINSSTEVSDGLVVHQQRSATDL